MPTRKSASSPHQPPRTVVVQSLPEEPTSWADYERVGGVATLSSVLGTKVESLGLHGPPGLPLARVSENGLKYGENRVPRKPPRGFMEHLWEAMEDETVRILVFSAVVSLAFGLFLSPPESRRADIIQACAIILAVVVVGGVNSFQNWSKDKEFQSLTALTADRLVRVRREGEDVQVSVYDVVVGDLVVLESGDFISCDGVLLGGVGVVVDESSVTGESAPVEKTPCHPPPGDRKADCLLQSGTYVKDGSGFMLITHVGTSTKMGRLTQMIENAEMEETPLQKRLDEMAGQIGQIGMAAGVLTFATLTILRIWAAASAPGGASALSWGFYFATTPAAPAPLVMDLVQYFIIGVAIVVVAVPEGLPLAVTIALAFSMRKMMKDQCMVKTMKSCETMGSATFICTDKTGTLTQNKMTVVKVATPFFVGGEQDMGELKRALVGGGGNPENVPYAWRLRDAICLTSQAGEYVGEGGDTVIKGNPTEFALVTFSDSLQADASRKHRALRERASLRLLARAPFTKEKKYQACVVNDSVERDTYCYVIGAPEVVLEFCTGDARGDEPERAGGVQVATWRKQKAKIVSEFGGGEGLRVLAVAYKTLGPAADKASPEKNLAAGTTDMGLLGLFGIKDPLRPDAAKAIKDCISAGIKVMMMTGDHEDTAKAIATQAGILSDGDLRSKGACIDGATFRKLCAARNPAGEEEEGVEEEEEEGEEGEGEGGEKGEEEEGRPAPSSKALKSPRAYISNAALKAAKAVRVMSRCTPEDKYLMVCALQREKEVVAVTGDGTNDALALRKADVGLAMGIAGTAVAKEASDIIILDDNFSSIVKAVSWGRGIKENIRKFLSFQLTINIVALTLTFISACTSGGRAELPLKPVQLLWVNLIMDSFAALALATEPPTPRLLQQKPQARDAPLITPIMFANMIGHALLQILVLLYLTQVPSSALLFQLKPTDLGNTHHDTIVFTAFVAMQWFNLFNCRSVGSEWEPFSNFKDSTFGILIQAVIAIAHYLIVEMGGSVMQTIPLTKEQWVMCIGIGMLSLVWGGVVVQPISVAFFGPSFRPDSATTSKEALKQKKRG